jgi:hypothetical protein
LVIVNNAEYVADLDMQDPRHNLTKLYTASDKASKDFVMGRHMASHSDCRATAELADKYLDEYGAIKRYLDRSDAHNKTGPSVLSARLMLKCMAKAINGDYGPKQPFEGSLAYGKLLSRFLLIFFGKKQSGLDRAKHAGYFLGLIRRARCHIVATPSFTLTANFLTAQTYAHAVYSAQVAILKLKAQRVFHSHLPAFIEETGSNAVEKLWSGTGGFGAIKSGQRGYDAAEGLRRIEDQVTLTKYESKGTGLNFGEEDRSTQRDIKINLHEDACVADADPGVHYDDRALIDAWIAGDEEAKVEAEKLGMKPSGVMSWWDRPWEKEEADIAKMN